MENDKNIKDMNFREEMEELNKTLVGLEGNTLELEDALDQYKYGVELLSDLKLKLNSAQVKVEELMGSIEADAVSDEQRDNKLSI